MWKRHDTLPLAVIAAVSLFLLFRTPPGDTLAYLTAREGKTGSFTTGQNTSQVVEQFSESSLQEGANNFPKQVAVKNTGNLPCYVRVILTFSDSTIAARSVLSADGENYYEENAFRAHLNPGWVYGADGSYYYEPILLPGEETTKLLEKVTTTFPEGAKLRDFEIIVYEESIQIRRGDGSTYTGSDACQQAFADFLSKSSTTAGTLTAAEQES
ncbi:MAG: hypothetical protein ACI4OJ_10540 [Lachnospiraceae bacterium]